MSIFKRPPDEDTLEVLGEPVLCQICKHDRFHRREAQLNTAVASLIGMDWTNPTATCYVCARCGFLHWFLEE